MKNMKVFKKVVITCTYIQRSKYIYTTCCLQIPTYSLDRLLTYSFVQSLLLPW